MFRIHKWTAHFSISPKMVNVGDTPYYFAFRSDLL